MIQTRIVRGAEAIAEAMDCGWSPDDTLPDGGKMIALHFYKHGDAEGYIEEYDNGRFSVTVENDGEYGTREDCEAKLLQWLLPMDDNEDECMESLHPLTYRKDMEDYLTRKGCNIADFAGSNGAPLIALYVFQQGKQDNFIELYSNEEYHVCTDDGEQTGSLAQCVIALRKWFKASDT